MDFFSILLTLVIGALGSAIGYYKGRSNLIRLEERQVSLEEQILRAEEQTVKEGERAEKEAARAATAERELATHQADLRHLTERLERQKQEYEELQEQFQLRFENLANRILEEKSRKFTEHNEEKMGLLLRPLGEKIEEFRKKVEETHREEIRGRSALEQHLKTLQSLNQNMAEEAKSLTRALKGDTKQQGNWGEVVLERILENSGLRKGEEYEVQKSFTTEEGRRLQPDVVVRLPDEKQLIIDSKVSLTAYERYASTDDEAERASALKQHITSLNKHVRDLSGKSYQHLPGGNSPDFVLMFIPIESAFSIAMQYDSTIYNAAFEKSIIIVSPTTLLATLATVESVWKQEYQNRNALEIARRGGALYDKFAGYMESMAEIGNRLEQTRKSYDQAMNRLSTGNGNVVRQVEMLRELGAQTSKQLPQDLVEKSRDLSVIQPIKERGHVLENGGSK